MTKSLFCERSVILSSKTPIIGFDDNRNLCSHAGVCVYVCVCVCVCVCVVTAQLVNTISQEAKHGQISYLVCRCITLSTRSLLFLSKVIWGQQGSNCENLVNMIFRSYIWYVGVPHWVKKPIVFGGGQRSFRGQFGSLFENSQKASPLTNSNGSSWNLVMVIL